MTEVLISLLLSWRQGRESETEGESETGDRVRE
jgi:hypothetical protein